MDKSPEQNRGKTTTNNKKRVRKGAVLQRSKPGWAFKGLGVAKRYCRRNSIGDTFMQSGDLGATHSRSNLLDKVR